MNLPRLISLASIPLVLFVQGCGGDKSKSSKIEIDQIATKPVVIDSNFTIDPTPNNSSSGDEIEVTGPWFPVRFAGSNPTDRTLTIASFVVKAEGRDENGNKTSSEYTPDLGDATIVLEIAAGANFEVEKTAYVGSLPESRNRSYRVTITFQGWFNKLDDPNTDIDESNQPDESFEKVITFSTQ